MLLFLEGREGRTGSTIHHEEALGILWGREGWTTWERQGGGGPAFNRPRLSSFPLQMLRPTSLEAVEGLAL